MPMFKPAPFGWNSNTRIKRMLKEDKAKAKAIDKIMEKVDGLPDRAVGKAKRSNRKSK